MTRALLPLATLASAYALAEALAHADWLIAVPLAVIVMVGIVLLAFDVAPAASAPASAAGDALAKETGK